MMIKKIALTLLPFVKPTHFSTLRSISFRAVTPSLQLNYFSTHKKTEQPNQKKEKKAQGAPQATAEKQAEPTTPKQRKLSQLSNQQLIQLNTQQSLKVVQINIKKMQQLRLKQQQQLKQLNEKVTYMDKHHNESVLKEQQLLENIKQQEEELQRIKKRADKEIQDSKDYGITKLVKQLLEFADSIKRCKQMAENLIKDKPDDQYLQKIIDLDKQLRQLLKLYQIQEFDPINQPFDPNTSQSLVTIPTPPGYQKNNVATTMMTGYKIKSRLLRSAKVGIFI